jgi:hypothetical protein
MAAGQRAALFFRIIYLFLFVMATTWLFLFSFIDIDPVFDSSMFDFIQVLNIVEYIMILTQEAISALTQVSFIAVMQLTGILGAIPIIGPIIGDGANANQGGITGSLLAIVNPANNFFPHSTITDISTIVEDFGNFIGATTILTLLPITFLSGLGFLRNGDTKLAIYSFLGFQLIIIIAIFTDKILISTVIDSSNIIAMLFSPLFFMGFMLYLLLEIAFQTSYTLNILEPMTEREKRIQKHLKRIRTFVPVSEESDAKSQEKAVQSMQSSKFGLLASSYLREMVENRVFKSGETAIDAKSMMRLQSYLANLNQSDPMTDQKLAAKTAQPDVSALLKHFIPTMILRVIAVIIFSYIIMSPESLLGLFLFPALRQSLELSQPEFRTIAIINIVLIFILISVILSYLSSGRTGNVLKRVVQQIDTLVDFDRTTKTAPTPGEMNEEEEAPLDDDEEDMS